jgi:Lipase
VGEVASVVAEFCIFLHQNYELDFNQLTLVGSSLGAHVAGMFL